MNLKNVKNNLDHDTKGKGSITKCLAIYPTVVVQQFHEEQKLITEVITINMSAILFPKQVSRH